MDLHHPGPCFALEKSLRVTDDEEEVAWPRDGYIKPSNIRQETETALDRGDGVRPHAVEDHDVFFSSLESINSINLDIAELAVHLSEPRAEDVLQVLDLSLVGSDNSDLACQALLE